VQLQACRHFSPAHLLSLAAPLLQPAASDVAAGALLGTVLGLAFAARAIGRLARVSEGAAAAAAAAGCCCAGGGSPSSLDGSPDTGVSLLHSGRVAHHSEGGRAAV
jgi:hypothetical protein